MTDPLEDRTCSRCKLVKPISEFKTDKRYPSGYTYLCLKCGAAVVRNIYDKNPAKKLVKNEVYRKTHMNRIREMSYKRIDKTKQKARQAVNNAVYAGKFEKKPCFCGNFKTDFHHTNGYDKDNWFTGEWLCRQHHHDKHKELRWQTA